jgi:Ca2+-binding EF-hand superfamily protein
MKYPLGLRTVTVIGTDFSEAFEMYAKGRGFIHQTILMELLELVEQPMPEDEVKDIIETMCKGKPFKGS